MQLDAAVFVHAPELHKTLWIPMSTAKTVHGMEFSC
jgi:hypothetical protein